MCNIMFKYTNNVLFMWPQNIDNFKDIKQWMKCNTCNEENSNQRMGVKPHASVGA